MLGQAERLRPALPFLGAVALAALTMLHGVQPNDEGLMLQAAARIAHGEVPYRDFWWFYPPGQPYLLAGLWGIFGPSLLVWRIVRVLADGAVAALAWSLARRGGAGRRPSGLAWSVSALAMASPNGPHPFPIALALCLGALLVFVRRPVVAGLLVGVAAAWRLEFAAWAGLGIVLALLLRPESQRAALRFGVAAVGSALVLLLPVALVAGIGPTWRLLVRYPLLDFRDYQTLPFPFRYDGPLNTGSPGGFLSDSAEPLLLFYVPLALVVGLAASMSGSFGRLRARDSLLIAAAVFAVGMLTYLLVRPDAYHLAPLAVLVAALGAWTWARAPRLVAVVATAALAVVLLGGLDRQLMLVRDGTVTLHAPGADGARTFPADARALGAAVADVRRRVPAGRPIYVTGLRNDLVTAGAPLFYVLAGRANPSRYDIAAPGVITSAPVQREIVDALSHTRTPLVVRWRSASTAAHEPNRAGRSSGVRILDSFLSASYRPVARHGEWQLLTRRR